MDLRKIAAGIIGSLIIYSSANAGWLDKKFKDTCDDLQDACRAMDPSNIERKVKGMIKEKAFDLARLAVDNGSDYEDCVTVVAAGITAYSAAEGAKGGPYAAAFSAGIGAAAGIPAARMACRRVCGR